MLKIKRHKILTFLFVVIALYNNSALAQKNSTSTSAEDVAIAFYKTGKSIPNFDRWIHNTEPYINTPATRRDTVYKTELNRLNLLYHNFTPEKDMVIVKTYAYLQTDEIINEEGNSEYILTSRFKNAPNALYFPYRFAKDNFVLLPYGLKEIMTASIPIEQYNYIKKNSYSRKPLIAIIRMKPHESDLSKPYIIDSAEQWVLKTKIASLEFWDYKSNLLWEYTAPWYTSKNTIEIRSLYRDRPYGEKKGNVKPIINTP